MDVHDRASPPTTLPGGTRWALAVVGCGLLALLALAALLSPDQRGFGTHQRLGLPPCTFRTMFGMRCPSCGMTTAWAHVVRADPAAAVRANTGGALLAIVAVVAGPWMVVSAARGRVLGGRLSQWTPVVLTVLIVVVTLIDWIVRLLA